jgi:hypothetical protein
VNLYLQFIISMYHLALTYGNRAHTNFHTLAIVDTELSFKIHCWSYKMQLKSKCWSRPIHKTPGFWFSYMNYGVAATAYELHICLPLSTRVAQYCVKLHWHCFVIKGSRLILPHHFLADCTKLYNVCVCTYIYIFVGTEGRHSTRNIFGLCDGNC